MVPSSLRTWFVIHFLADVIFALPLFLAPRWTLSLLGWPAVDPLATRLVAAALFGIGIQSLLGRGEGAAAFRALLNLKIIPVLRRSWSAMSSETAYRPPGVASVSWRAISISVSPLIVGSGSSG